MRSVTNQRLTARQKQVFDFVREFIEANHFAPSVREVADRFRIASPSAAAKHLSALQAKGLLRIHGRARSIEIIGEKASTLNGIPLLGKVPAGVPQLAIEDLSDSLTWRDLYGDTSGLFALRVRGNSMTGAGILDGDFVVARLQSTVRNGEIAIVLIGQDPEATVKRVFIERDRIRLQPENQLFESVVFRLGDEDLRIIGRIVGVVRKF